MIYNSEVNYEDCEFQLVSAGDSSETTTAISKAVGVNTVYGVCTLKILNCLSLSTGVRAG